MNKTVNELKSLSVALNSSNSFAHILANFSMALQFAHEGCTMSYQTASLTPDCFVLRSQAYWHGEEIATIDIPMTKDQIVYKLNKAHRQAIANGSMILTERPDWMRDDAEYKTLQKQFS